MTSRFMTPIALSMAVLGLLMATPVSAMTMRVESHVRVRNGDVVEEKHATSTSGDDAESVRARVELRAEARKGKSVAFAEKLRSSCRATSVTSARHAGLIAAVRMMRLQRVSHCSMTRTNRATQ